MFIQNAWLVTQHFCEVLSFNRETYLIFTEAVCECEKWLSNFHTSSGSTFIYMLPQVVECYCDFHAGVLDSMNIDPKGVRNI
jgi:hypothetical protein